MAEAFIYDHLRTPRGKGKKDGALHQASPVWLLRTLLKALQARSCLDTAQVDDVVLGCVTPVGEQGADIARTAVLDAEWAQTVAGVTQPSTTSSTSAVSSHRRCCIACSSVRSSHTGLAWCRAPSFLPLPRGVRRWS